MIEAAPIAREELAERVARVREGMGESGLDALVCYGAHVDYAPGDLRYLADWFCIEEEQAILVVPADGTVALVTDSAADLDRARERAGRQPVEETVEMMERFRRRGHAAGGVQGGGARRTALGDGERVGR